MTDLVKMAAVIRACGEMLPEPPKGFGDMRFGEALGIMKAFEPMTEKLALWGDLWDRIAKGSGDEQDD